MQRGANFTKPSKCYTFFKWYIHFFGYNSLNGPLFDLMCEKTEKYSTVQNTKQIAIKRDRRKNSMIV